MDRIAPTSRGCYTFLRIAKGAAAVKGWHDHNNMLSIGLVMLMDMVAGGRKKVTCQVCGGR